MWLGQADVGRRLGLAMAAMLILLIGRRIIPSFTCNWLARRGPGPMPAPSGRLDAVSLGVTLPALLVWVALPDHVAAAWGLMLARVVQAARMARWCGWRTVDSPLLLMLHVAVAFLPVGLFTLGLTALGLVPAVTGWHLPGIGGVGGMTLAMMMRVSLGHTGRALDVGPILAAAFACVVLSALFRALAPRPESGWRRPCGPWPTGCSSCAMPRS